MHTHMCTEVGVSTYQSVCECLDNLVCGLLSRSGSVYLYMCVPLRMHARVCVCEASSSALILKALWGFYGGCL